MLKPFSRTLLALALLSPLTVQAQQDDAARQKELEAARTDLRRAAQRVAELSRGTDTLRAPIRIDRVVAGRPRLGVLWRLGAGASLAAACAAGLAVGVLLSDAVAPTVTPNDELLSAALSGYDDLAGLVNGEGV